MAGVSTVDFPGPIWMALRQSGSGFQDEERNHNWGLGRYLEAKRKRRLGTTVDGVGAVDAVGLKRERRGKHKERSGGEGKGGETQRIARRQPSTLGLPILCHGAGEE